MTQETTRRGNTQKNKNVVNQNNGHSRVLLSGISLIRICKGKVQLLLYKQPGQKGDPRLQTSGMTSVFNTPSPRALRDPLPQGARECFTSFRT